MNIRICTFRVFIDYWSRILCEFFDFSTTFISAKSSNLTNLDSEIRVYPKRLNTFRLTAATLRSASDAQSPEHSGHHLTCFNVKLQAKRHNSVALPVPVSSSAAFDKVVAQQTDSPH